MSVTSIDKDFDELTLTVIADFAAPIESVWQLWADPRLLERWWGPPMYPATVEVHELRAGGDVTYYMTGPEGDRHRGWWRITAVEPPETLELIDGFADQNGTPMEGMPVSTMTMRLSEYQGGTRMETRARYESREQLEQVLAMGMEEGLRLAIGQMDALLAG